MRRSLFAAALGALLMILVVAPAGAVSPNEALLARHLAKLGVIPSYATPEMANSTVRTLYGSGPNYELKSPLVQRVLRGKQTALGRFLVRRMDDPGPTETYTTKTLVLLVEFGDDPWPAGSPSPTGPMTPGPQHGSVPAPAPNDNSTYWPGDFSPMHYQQELFGNSYPLYDSAGSYLGSSDATMRNYYLEQSHGTFTVAGDIADWVRLDMPESWYGADSDPWNSTDDLTGPVWRVARDAVVKFAAQNPDFPWAEYDNENPYGITGDNFYQADGYVDHLILIHAGSDQSAGGGAQDSDAIWAHSWGILENTSGGPGDMPGAMVPGTEGQGPQHTGIWVYPYTINPEDGDPGVFCHEFGHDLGLPDEYDYSSTTGDASSGFWTIMASGSWLGRQWGLGSQPSAMNVWDKYALGFVTPKVVKRNTTATVRLQPAATGEAASTGVMIPLPKRKHLIELSGKDGTLEWYSDMGNDLDNRLTTKSVVAVPEGDQAVLALRTWYDIEEGYDYGYVRVSADGGITWTTVESPGNTVEVQPGEYALTGTDTEHWADTIAYDLSAYAGTSVLLQFRYFTDGGVANRGWEVTDLKLGGVDLATSSFGTAGWLRIDGEKTSMSDNYYIAEYRTRDGSDAALKNCYQFNGLYANWVDWFSYNQGLHLIYRDTFWNDNDVASHLGEGGWMVVDARPQPDGIAYGATIGYWRPRIQVRDAAFSVKRTPSQSIWFTDYDAGESVGEYIAPGKGVQAWFKDTWSYWYSETPEAGVKIPGSLGVRIQVKRMDADGITIWVDNRK